MTISIISACKNRGRALSVSISSWIQFDEVTEIVVVDWNSDESIDSITSLDERIKVLKVYEEKYFNQPQPLNLAASVANSEYILKLDCDHLINPYFNFFDIHPIEDDEFVIGLNFLKGNEILHPLWGLLFLKKEHFEKVGGYNENMGKYYAVEDDELTLRLISYGLTARPIEINKLSMLHIPHPDKNRVENFESFENIEKILNNKNSTEKLYSLASTLSKRKNFDVFPQCSKIFNLFETKNFNKINLDWYSEPIYKWKVNQIENQIYECFKV
jgi:GT2 family glycosyltransferase